MSQAARRRRRRQRQEFGARITVAILILLFNELVIPNLETASIIRLTGLIALVLNGALLPGPAHWTLAARAGLHPDARGRRAAHRRPLRRGRPGRRPVHRGLHGGAGLRGVRVLEPRLRGRDHVRDGQLPHHRRAPDGRPAGIHASARGRRRRRRGVQPARAEHRRLAGGAAGRGLPGGAPSAHRAQRRARAGPRRVAPDELPDPAGRPAVRAGRGRRRCHTRSP